MYRLGHWEIVRGSTTIIMIISIWRRWKNPELPILTPCCSIERQNITCIVGRSVSTFVARHFCFKVATETLLPIKTSRLIQYQAKLFFNLRCCRLVKFVDVLCFLLRLPESCTVRQITLPYINNITRSEL